LRFHMHNLSAVKPAEVRQELVKIGADSAGAALMETKGLHHLIKVYDLAPRQANIIKQEMLSKGGEAAVARGSVDASVEKTDVLLMGTERQYRALIRKLRAQPFSLSKLAAQLEEVLHNLRGRKPRLLACRDKTIPLGERTLVMGILNITPDSFSDGGQYNELEIALQHARQMEADGADIIDVGGESTRPKHVPIGLEEELNRVLPVLQALLREIKIPLSIDTTKSEVARLALAAGVHLVNDQWSLRLDPALGQLCAEYGAPLVMMHNQQGTDYRDIMGDMVRFFEESIDMALAAGMSRDKIIIDPGIGFGKTAEQNIEVIRRMRELDCLGLPVLLGPSRKLFIGKTLNLPPDQRVEGTAATVTLGIVNGADIVRVHDVREMVRVAKMTDALLCD